MAKGVGERIDGIGEIERSEGGEEIGGRGQSAGRVPVQEG